MDAARAHVRAVLPDCGEEPGVTACWPAVALTADRCGAATSMRRADPPPRSEGNAWASEIAFQEALGPDFKAYQQQVVKNADVLARTLIERGLRIVSGRTESEGSTLLREVRGDGGPATRHLCHRRARQRRARRTGPAGVHPVQR